jgi:hypothetical protein
MTSVLAVSNWLKEQLGTDHVELNIKVRCSCSQDCKIGKYQVENLIGAYNDKQCGSDGWMKLTEDTVLQLYSQVQTSKSPFMIEEVEEEIVRVAGSLFHQTFDVGTFNRLDIGSLLNYVDSKVRTYDISEYLLIPGQSEFLMKKITARLDSRKYDDLESRYKTGFPRFSSRCLEKVQSLCSLGAVTLVSKETYPYPRGPDSSDPNEQGWSDNANDPNHNELDDYEELISVFLETYGEVGLAVLLVVCLRINHSKWLTPLQRLSVFQKGMLLAVQGRRDISWGYR